MTNFIKMKLNHSNHPVYINVEHITFISRTLTGENFMINYVGEINGGLILEISRNLDAIEQLKQYGVILWKLIIMAILMIIVILLV